MNRKEKFYLGSAGIMMGLTLYAFCDLCFSMGKSVAYRHVCEELKGAVMKKTSTEA